MTSWYRDIATLPITGSDSRPGRAGPVKLLVTGAAHVTSHNANLEPVIEGPAISLAAVHAKVRRAGYAK
jgi:hypothetical protein